MSDTPVDVSMEETQSEVMPEPEKAMEPDMVNEPEKANEPEKVMEAEKPKETEKVNEPQADTKPKTKKRKRKTTLDYAIEFGIKIAVTAICVWILCAYIVGIHVNHGNSSYPMIKDGDLVITYRLGDLHEGEEIAYKHDGKLRFGRIVARGGDVVDITQTGITVNGYGISEEVVYPTTPDGAKIKFPYTVPANSV